MNSLSYYSGARAQSHPAGFTLVEIMVVVVIVGLLALMAAPAIRNAKEESYKSRLINDFRQMRYGFDTYALENGGWPDDEAPGVLPAVMDGYISPSSFEEPAPLNGVWDWEGPGAFSFTAGVSLRGSSASDDFMVQLDASIDDGVLSTGNFQETNDGVYTYILEQ